MNTKTVFSILEILPKECWYQILNKLDVNELEPVSLVCKDFLSISNSLRHRLRFIVHDYSFLVEVQQLLPRLLRRFASLEEISLIRDDIPCKGNIGYVDSAILDISLSGLKNLKSLDISCRCNCGANNKNSRIGSVVVAFKNFTQLGSTMKNLKKLSCSVCGINNDILHQIGNSFSFLEELYVQDPCNENYCFLEQSITDYGVLVMTSKLKYLKKVALAGYLTDSSIFAISSNCVSLRELTFIGLTNITENGIGHLLRNCPNLVSLSASFYNRSVDVVGGVLHPVSSSAVENSLAYAKKLENFEVESFNPGDRALSSIVDAQIPLKKVRLSLSENNNFSALESFLIAYPSLYNLRIGGDEFLTDNSFRILSKYFTNLTSLCVESYDLTNLSFTLLVRNCTSLKRLDMVFTRLGEGEFDTSFGENEKIEHLELLWNSKINDETLENIVQVCPKLEHFYLNYVNVLQITYRSIRNILKRCEKLKVLRLYSFFPVKLFEAISIPCKLNIEELVTNNFDIDDEVLDKLGRMCSRLRKLELRSCAKITECGVINVVTKCKILMRLDLRYCSGISSTIKSRIFGVRPTLHVSL